MQNLMRDAAWMIDALSAKARPMPSWIRPEDRMPPVGRPVLICREKDLGVPIVEQARYLGAVGGKLPWKVYGANLSKVDWWMEMPEPPEVET